MAMRTDRRSGASGCRISMQGSRCRSMATWRRSRVSMRSSAKVFVGTTRSIRQMSMPKPVCPNMATATPLGPPGPQTAQKQYARVARGGRAAICRQNPSSEGAARKVSASVRRATFRTPPRHRAFGPGTWKDPDPGDGAAGDQRAQNRPACPAMAATQRLRAVPYQRLPGAMISGAPAVL